ncbi:ABC transporter permease [bacterium]|nr:ABC transporter permease [bacterium]
MKDSLSRIYVLTKRNIKEILRDPLSLIFTLGLPLVMEVLFYLIFHNLTTQFEMKYLAPGIVVFAESFLALFVGMLLALDRSTSFLTRLYVSKAKSYEFILSYVLSIVPLVFIQSILFFLIGGIIDTSIFKISMIFSILLSIVTSIFYTSIGLLLGSLCTEKSIGGVSSIIIAGQSVLSGMWFPLDGISDGMITFMNILPFRNATMLIQNTLNGINDTFNDFVLPLIIVLSYTLVSLIISILVFKKKMKQN